MACFGFVCLYIVFIHENFNFLKTTTLWLIVIKSNLSARYNRRFCYVPTLVMAGNVLFGKAHTDDSSVFYREEHTDTLPETLLCLSVESKKKKRERNHQLTESGGELFTLDYREASHMSTLSYPRNKKTEPQRRQHS